MIEGAWLILLIPAFFVGGVVGIFLGDWEYQRCPELARRALIRAEARREYRKKIGKEARLGSCPLQPDKPIEGKPDEPANKQY